MTERKDEVSTYAAGPWTFSPRDAQRGFAAQVWGADDIALAFIDNRTDNTMDANARLIASAPCLLTALEQAEKTMVLLYRGIIPAANRPDGSNAHADNDKSVQMARAAIAKAKEETP